MRKSTLGEKIILLANKGYASLPERDIYFNIKSRKCFSLKYILETPLSKIKAQMSRPTNKVEVYFSKNLPFNIKKQLEKEIIDIILSARSR